jgi:hypothetical protein
LQGSAPGVGCGPRLDKVVSAAARGVIGEVARHVTGVAVFRLVPWPASGSGSSAVGVSLFGELVVDRGRDLSLAVWVGENHPPYTSGPPDLAAKIGGVLRRKGLAPADWTDAEKGRSNPAVACMNAPA